MATVENYSALEKTTDVPKESNSNGRSTSPEFNIQDGGYVVSSIPTSSLQQNSVGVLVPAVTVAQAVSATNGTAEKDFPALQNTTKPIPPSMLSYRFASPTSNQTPYYVSSDIVLSGGIAQQTRRRIVHNEVEKRRKDKINNWILKLAQVVPQCRWGKQSKNIVLEKTVEYISQVNDQLKEFSDLQQREQNLAQEVQQLKNRLGNATKEIKVLKDLLKKHSIAIPRKVIAMQDSIATHETGNVPVAMTTVRATTKATPAVVTMTTSKPAEFKSPGTVSTSPAVVTMVTQVPITSASVAGHVLRDSSKEETVAYVAPFIIANNPVSLTTNKTRVIKPPVTPSVVPVVAPVIQNVATNTGQQGLSQLQSTDNNSAKLSNPHQGIYTQLPNNLVNSSAQQPVQTLSVPASSSQLVTTSQTGFSQHSVAEIMKVALQPGTSISPLSVVNAAPLASPALGNNTTAILQPAVVNTPVAVSSASASTVLVSTPSTLPASSNLINRVPVIENAAVAQSGSLPAFYVTTAPNQTLSVAVVTQNDGSVPQQKASSDASKTQGGNKNIKSASFSKAQTKASTRTQNAKRSSQNKVLPENRTSSGTNKRGAAHLPVVSDTIMAKRTNTCNPQDTQGHMSICQPQGEIMTLQTFNVTALIPGIATQGSSPNNDMVSNRDDYNKPVAQVSTMGASQTAQVPRLSHSIASLAGLSQSIGPPQPSPDLQQHQQISQLGSGNLSFSAESLLASSDVFLPNIPHITTNSVSDNNTSQQNALTMAPASSLHSTPNDQGQTQSYSNYSAEALIGGSEIMTEPVITQESQIQTRPSRTTYSDFSAESLIGSNDLNSGLSYAIDNLISSRSDANYNINAMVSVNPNLLHSVKSNISQDTVTNPLRALAALPELVEQKSSIPSSQATLLYSGMNSTYGLSPSNSTPTSLTLQSNSNRRQRDSALQHQGVAQTGNSSNSSVSSTSFLKHSVDSITSSFYAVSNTGSGLSLGSISGSSFQPQGSFGMDSLSGGQLSFGSLANPFSPTRPLFNHSSTMGSFV